MEYQNFVDKLFLIGKEEGFEDMEVYFEKQKEFQTTVFKAEVDKFSISESAGLSFRGLYNNKMGYSYTEILDEESLNMLILEAKENAKAIQSEDKVEILSKQKKYIDTVSFNPELNEISKKEKINFLKNVEKEIMKLDNRIKTLAYSLYADFEVELKLSNTKGIDLNQKTNLALAYISALATENGKNKTGSILLINRDFKKFDVSETAKRVVAEAVSLLGAKTIKSKEYEVIFRNGCAASLLQAFSGVINAENVQKDLSFLKGKINKKIASDVVNIIDDPFMKDGFVNTSFDAEGMNTKVTEVIKDGTLKSFLHNLKTATKDGIESTGNASKDSYKSSVNIAQTNLYIQKGNRNLASMTKDIKEGLIITELMGLHSGLNPISGDFSLAGVGFLVENGEIIRPVDQFTVAGNLRKLLLNITEVGNDLDFTIPVGNSFTFSPSLKVSSLSIAGE